MAYPPGLSMRPAADLRPGEARTDARDAFVIAETARTMPHTLRAVDRDDEVPAELTMLTGHDNDLPARSTVPPTGCGRRTGGAAPGDSQSQDGRPGRLTRPPPTAPGG